MNQLEIFVKPETAAARLAAVFPDGRFSNFTEDAYLQLYNQKVIGNPFIRMDLCADSYRSNIADPASYNEARTNCIDFQRFHLARIIEAGTVEKIFEIDNPISRGNFDPDDISIRFFADMRFLYDFASQYAPEKWTYGNGTIPTTGLYGVDFTELPPMSEWSLYLADDVEIEGPIDRIMAALEKSLPSKEEAVAAIHSRYEELDISTILDVLHGLRATERPHLIFAWELIPENIIRHFFQAGIVEKMIEAKATNRPPADPIMAMNAEYAAVLNAGSFSVLREYSDPISGHKTFDLMPPHAFNNWFQNDKITIATKDKNGKPVTKEVPKSVLWLKSRSRRQYHGIVFSPKRDHPGRFNLWQGFAIEPAPGDWSIMKNHILEVWCRCDEKLFDWVFSWIARCVQDPGGHRPGTALVLSGPQGCGKSLLVSQIGKIFGQHFHQCIGTSRLTSRFNRALQDKLLVFCDEAASPSNGIDDAMQVLRALVTEPVLEVEPKGIDPYTIKTHINLIISGNSNHILNADSDERRFCFLKCSGAHVGDFPYFDEMISQMDCGGRQAMLYDLLRHKIRVNLRDVPKTDFLSSQVVHSLGPVRRWWHQCLDLGEILPGHGEWLSGSLFETETLFASFRQSTQLPGLAKSVWSRELKTICPSLTLKRIGSSKTKAYAFRTLEQSRNDFSTVIGHTLEWTDVNAVEDNV